jgi:hypothetical protein
MVIGNRRNKAEECNTQGIKIFEELKIRPFHSQGHLCLGDLYTDTGQKEKTRENFKNAEDNLRHMGMDYWLAKTQEVWIGSKPT